MKYTQEQEQLIIKLHAEGLSPTKIGKKLGTYNTTIRRILLRNNITLKNSAEALSIMKSNSFADLSNPDTFYWLGLLATDGCVTKINTVILDLKAEDKHILESYVKYLNSPVKIVTTTHYTGIKSFRVGFSDKNIRETLESYGISKRKTLTLDFKLNINFDFLRGLIDGDGCVSFMNNKKGIRLQIASASDVFINQIQSFLIDKGFSPIISINTKGRKNKLYILSIYKQQELYNLYQCMYYKDGLPYLHRKRVKYGPLLEKFNR
jgi:intein/homing endonuclease